MQVKDELLDIEGIKNSSKNLIDLFIRRTAVLTSTPEDLVEKIIKDQWRRANQTASGKTDVAEIDLCNLGTFYISPNKAKKKIIILEKTLIGLDEKGSMIKSEQILKDKKENILSLIKAIKTKIKQTNES